VGVVGWMCGVGLDGRRGDAELGGLLGLEPVGLMVGGSGLGWFGRVERKDGSDWVGRCVEWEIGELDRGDARGAVASPASGHVGTCPPWRLGIFFRYTLKQVVWFGLVLCQTL